MATDSAKKKCAHCGTTNASDAQFCSSCGKLVAVAAASADPFVGRLISQRFKIDGRIASGGMGEVYRARHIELQQNVAVKFLHRRFADDEEIAARFFNEARSACKVKHPLAVTIYDFGRLEDGTLFLVMEFVEGISLTRFIRRDGPLAPAMMVRFASQLCEVLAAAHEVGVVHRDVKPDNIMIVESSSGHHTIKVLDFGIAKMLDDENSKGLTQTGMMFGTPEYMSPEQASGKEVDRRSDIYSLGLVLYSMLAGHPPFLGQNKLQLLQRQIHEKHAPIDRASRHALPVELATLIDEMLHKEASKRPQTMATVLGRLEEMRSTLPASNSGMGVMPPPPQAPAPGKSDKARGSILTHKNRAVAAAPAQEAFSFEDSSGSESTDGFELGDVEVGDSRSFGGTGAFEMGASRRAGRAEDAYELGDTSATGEFEDVMHTERSLPPLRESRVGLMLGFAGGAIVLAALIGFIFHLQRAGDALERGEDTNTAALAAASADTPAEASGAAEGSAAMAVATPAAMPATAPGATAASAATGATAAAAAPAANVARPAHMQAAAPATAPVATAPVAATAPVPAAAAPAPEAAPAVVAAAEPATAELDRAARSALERLRAGDDAGARASLASLAQQSGADTSAPLAELRQAVGRLDAFAAAIEQHLATGNCVRADENVVSMREDVSREVATRYYGRLDACRAASRPQSADARPAPARTEPARAEPARTVPAVSPEPSGGGRVRPPAEL